MNGNVHFVSNFDTREVHQSGVEDDPLGVADLGDGLCHDVILCFTERQLSTMPAPNFGTRSVKRSKRPTTKAFASRRSTSNAQHPIKGIIMSDRMFATANGADGISDIEGKAAMGSSERVRATSEFQWNRRDASDPPSPRLRRTKHRWVKPRGQHEWERVSESVHWRIRHRMSDSRVRYPCAIAPTINTTKLVATAIATFVSTDKFINFSLWDRFEIQRADGWPKTKS